MARRFLSVCVAAALTALSFAVLPQTSASAGDGIVAGGVFVPDNAAVHEANSFYVNQVVNGGIVTLVNRTEFDALGYTTAGIYTVPVGSLNSVPWWPKGGTLVRERSALQVWLIDDGPNRFWIESPSVLAALGYTMADIRVVANGSLGGFTVGDSIGSGDLAGEVFDPNAGSVSGYHHASDDAIGLTSANNKAIAIGKVSWYHGGFPFGYRHRGQYTSGSFVAAREPVGCIWARIKWGYPLGSISFPPAVTIGGAEEVGDYFVNCRGTNDLYPANIKLAGLSYSKALLNSSTLTICTSATKSAGPRWCGTQKMTY